jgi:hypothetical protein
MAAGLSWRPGDDGTLTSDDYRSLAILISDPTEPLRQGDGLLSMSYLVKWRLNGERRTLQSPDTYAVPADAIGFASTIFAQHPIDIWIEGPDGLRIERDVILRASENRGPPRLSPRVGTFPQKSSSGR